jgi:hypothetical protein
MAILLEDSTEYISDIIIDWQRTFENPTSTSPLMRRGQQD